MKPEILVAIISGGAAVITAILAGVFSIMANNNATKANLKVDGVRTDLNKLLELLSQKLKI